MNPEPMAPFFDAIVIGEGEEVVDTLVDTILDVGDDDRRELLAALDRIEGVYVPQLVPAWRGRWTDSDAGPARAASSACGCATWSTTPRSARSTPPTPSSAGCT